MAALLLSAFIAGGACGCSKKKANEIKDESGLVLSGKMPDELPEGMSWYDFKEDTVIFDYLTETIGGYYLSDVTWYDGRTWVFLCETEPALPRRSEVRTA